MEEILTGDQLGEILKLVANVLMLLAWVWRHRPRG
jgi:hypothetical protein